MIFKRSAYFFLALLFWSCKKDPPAVEIKNLNENKIAVLGHGGMGIHYKYPMNSYESLKECLSTGAKGTEMDVCVTKDGVMVLSHSQDLSDQTECSGLIKNKNYAEIKECKFNKPFFSKSDLIEASYFFDRIENINEPVFAFDCKIELDDNAEYLNVFANALLKHIQKYNLGSHCFIESFNFTFLQILQAKNPALHLFLYTKNYQDGLAISNQVNLYGLTLDYENISVEDIAEAHKHNLRITLFNTRTEQQNFNAVVKNPDFIETDKVDYLIQILKE